jgi:hypothetical protein
MAFFDYHNIVVGLSVTPSTIVWSEFISTMSTITGTLSNGGLHDRFLQTTVLLARYLHLGQSLCLLFGTKLL